MDERYEPWETDQGYPEYDEPAGQPYQASYRPEDYPYQDPYAQGQLVYDPVSGQWFDPSAPREIRSKADIWSVIASSLALLTALVCLLVILGVIPATFVSGTQIKPQAVGGDKIALHAIGPQQVATDLFTDLPKGPRGRRGPAGEDGAPGFAGYEVVERQFGPADGSLSAEVPCPENKQVIGGGALIDGAESGVALIKDGPNDEGTAWTTLASEVGDGTIAGWTLTVRITCAVIIETDQLAEEGGSTSGQDAAKSSVEPGSAADDQAGL